MKSSGLQSSTSQDHQELQDEKVLITGGAGSLGSALVKEALGHGAKTVRVLDNDEYGLSNLGRRLRSDKLRLLLGDIRDLDRVRMAVEGADLVYHCAAIKNLEVSEYNPIEACKTNIAGTSNLVEAALSARSPPGRFIFVSCLDGETQLVTKYGIKGYQEIRVGDVVFTINPRTGILEEQPVRDVHMQDYSGQMFAFKGKRVDLLVTPSHKMFVETSKGRFYEPVEKTAERATWVMPEALWTERDSNGRFRARGAMVIPRWEISDEWRQFHWRANRHVKRVGKSLNWLPAYLSSDALFYLVGIFIGDGFLNPERNPEREKRSNSVFLAIPSQDKSRSKVEGALKTLGVAWHTVPRTSFIQFSSYGLSQLFSQCGRGAKNKRIPLWMLDFTSDHLQHLFDGLIDSDGHRGAGGNLVFHTVSEGLVRDIIELAIKIGLHPNVGFRQRMASIKGRKISSPGAWVVSFGRTQKHCFRHHVSKEQYSGKVWCITVENGNFLVLRGGRLSFTGNSDKAVHHSTLYGATKFAGEKIALWADRIQDRTRFAVARPGNFLKSRGNVFEVWDEQLTQGKPLSITHPDMQRFFIATEEAALFLIKIAFRMKGGEIFIPRMDEKKIIDLAREKSKNLIQVGLRPGEKLKEQLCTQEEQALLREENGLLVIRG